MGAGMTCGTSEAERRSVLSAHPDQECLIAFITDSRKRFAMLHTSSQHTVLARAASTLGCSLVALLPFMVGAGSTGSDPTAPVTQKSTQPANQTANQTAATAPTPRDARIAKARALPALRTDGSTAFIPLEQLGANPWTGVSAGTTVSTSPATAESPSRLAVSYTRARGQAFGVAFMLPFGATSNAESLRLGLRGEPAQRLVVCLTDADGFVWSFPSAKAEESFVMHTLRLDSLKPDRFQNGGRTAPASPDLSALGMLTILDISGHMGGGEVPCRWTIDAAEIVSVPGSTPGSAPGAAPLAATPVGQTAAPDRSTPTAPTAVRAARELFFEALQRDPTRRPEAIAALSAVIAANPDDGRSTLLLGAAHLWAAADLATPDSEAANHLATSIRHFDRAAELLPIDDRIASWQWSARGFLARREGRAADVAAAIAGLRPHAESDPCFHSVAYGMLAWHEPTDSEAFTSAVALASRAFDCGRDGGSAGSNGPRWPYSVQGFLVGHADLLTRAGDADGAEAALLVAAAHADTATWPHRALIDERLDALKERITRFSDSDPANDPRFAWADRSSDSCVLCHATK